MKNIILDHYRRWWWVWVIGGLGWGVMNLVLANPAPGAGTQSSNAFPLAVFLGAFLLSMDLQRGHARAVLAMPLLPSQVARAWWLVSVAVPAILLLLISLAAWGIAWLIYPNPPLIYPVASNWAQSLLLLGVSFFAVSGLPVAGYGAGGWKDQARGGLFGVLYGGMCGGWMFLSKLNLHTPLGGGIFALAFILSVLGWYRAEPLVMERAGRRATSPVPEAPRNVSSRCAEGHGGLSFLAQTIFIRMVVIGLAMFVMFYLIMSLIAYVNGASSMQDMFGNLFGNSGMPGVFSFQFLWMMSIQLIAFAMHVRHLRALPVSSSIMAGVLVLAPLAAMALALTVIVLVAGMISDAPLPALNQLVKQGCLLQLAGATLTVPLLIWRGIDVVNYLIGMVILVGGMISTMIWSARIPLGVHLVIAPVIVLGVYLATKLLLERNSRVYRPRSGQFGGWNFGGR